MGIQRKNRVSLMAKEEWGIKHTCPDCGTKFYDLRKDPIICPNCGKHIIVDQCDMMKPPVDDEEPGLPEDQAPVVMDEDEESNVGIDDNVLDDSDEDTISLEEISDIPEEEEE